VIIIIKWGEFIDIEAWRLEIWYFQLQNYDEDDVDDDASFEDVALVFDFGFEL